MHPVYTVGIFYSMHWSPIGMRTVQKNQNLLKKKQKLIFLNLLRKIIKESFKSFQVSNNSRSVPKVFVDTQQNLLNRICAVSFLTYGTYL